MAATVATVAYLGLEARAVEVQVQLTSGVPRFTIVGLPDKAVAESRERVRAALENYFSGEFETASAQFARLSQEMPKNGWIWAFLGASQYSRYAFEADESYKSQAMQSFKKAKRYRSWKDGLPQKYFSKRIRRVFESAS